MCAGDPGGARQLNHLLPCDPDALTFSNRYSVIIYSKANIQTLRKYLLNKRLNWLGCFNLCPAYQPELTLD